MMSKKEKIAMKNRNGVLLPHKEAAQRLNVSGRTLANWNLDKIRIGRKIYYEEQLIEKILLEGWKHEHKN